MKVSYYPDTDSLFVKLKPGLEVEGSEVASGIVFHYTPEGEVTAIDIDSKASNLVDLSLLEVEGMPVGVPPPPGKGARPFEVIEARVLVDQTALLLRLQMSSPRPAS